MRLTTRRSSSGSSPSSSEGYKGIVGAYHHDAQRHDGMGVEAAVFVLASSFEDGAYDLAPRGGATG